MGSCTAKGSCQVKLLQGCCETDEQCPDATYCSKGQCTKKLGSAAARSDNRLLAREVGSRVEQGVGVA
ncbi:MAG: hypothetical protein ACI9OJ_004706 [Myxococcota bacterium]